MFRSILNTSIQLKYIKAPFKIEGNISHKMYHNLKEAGGYRGGSRIVEMGGGVAIGAGFPLNVTFFTF